MRMVSAPSTGTITEYAGSYVYEGGTLQFFNHPEGYVTSNGNGGYDYVYQYKDHLGNVRLSYMDNNGTLEIIEENNYYPFGLEHKGYNNVVSGAEYPYKYQGKEHEQELGLNTYDFGARNYMPGLGRWTTIDPLAEGFMEYSPYNAMMNNPIMFIDPDGRAAMSPIYGTDGSFLETDDEGLQGKAIVMDAENFTQGMSHDDALKNSKGVEGLVSAKAGSNLLNHYNGLKDRPDYDGFVTISEGVDWARNNVGALNNPTPDNMLYIDASKLDFGDVNTSQFQNLNEPTPINLFSKNNLLNSGLNSKLRGTVYALGRVNMQLTDRTWGKVQIVNDFQLQNAGDRATDYDWNLGGTSWMRRQAIGIERTRTGLNDTHGFRAYYYGTGSVNLAPGRGITPPPVN
ncbi:MAG: RHS repeat-associated core domain-containing protein [Flavobacteriaceae bacterium]